MTNQEPKEIKGDIDLISNLESMATDAVSQNHAFNTVNEDLFARYVGDLYGDEDEDLSSVLANDVEDVVNAYMVSMSRVFLGSGEVIEFEPNDPDDQEDIDEANQKSKYADWLIRGQPESYHTLFSALFEIILLKYGAVKYFIEEKKETKEEEFTGITAEELALFEESLEGEDVDKIEIIEKSGDLNGQDPIDFKFKVTRTTKKLRIVPVPAECFLITKDARSKEEAPLVGDDTPIMRGELVEMGYSKEQIAKIPRYNSDKNDDTSLDEQRNREQGSDTEPWKAPTWASEQVNLKTRYVLIDFDGDGIAERRYILYAGQEVLENEQFDHIPYAIGSSHIMPHRVIGRSVGEQCLPYAKQNTAIMRGMFDNIYAVNDPRVIHNELVNQDDLLDSQHGSTIRIEGEGPIGDSLRPFEIPYIGDKTLQIIQYQFQRRANTTGTLLTSQGLQADDFAQETATRFEGVQSEGNGKVELVARNIAETFFRQLYTGVIWMVTHFQNSEQEIRVLGERLVIDPSEWKRDHQADVKVGLGAGDEDHIVDTMTGLLNLQTQLKGEGSVMVDEVKRYNTVKSLLRGLGINNISKHFNNPDPEMPAEQMLSINEQLMEQNEQLLAAVEQLQKNPLAEAETIKQQGQLISKDKDQALDIEKLKVETFNKAADREFKYTELEVTESVDIPGKGVNG